MKVTLRPADRSNWRAMVGLQLKPKQNGFVSPPAWSLARCYVRFYADDFEHLPQLIYAGREAVGYSTTLCTPASERASWLDDIMIDAAQPGRGYGRAAVMRRGKLM